MKVKLRAQRLDRIASSEAAELFLSVEGSRSDFSTRTGSPSRFIAVSLRRSFSTRVWPSRTKQFVPKQTPASGLLVNKQHIYFWRLTGGDAEGEQLYRATLWSRRISLSSFFFVIFFPDSLLLSIFGCPTLVERESSTTLERRLVQKKNTTKNQRWEERRTESIKNIAANERNTM